MVTWFKSSVVFSSPKSKSKAPGSDGEIRARDGVRDFFRATREIPTRRERHERHSNTILHFGNLDDGALPRISALDGGENSVLKPRERNISAVVQLSGLLPAMLLAKIPIRLPRVFHRGGNPYHADLTTSLRSNGTSDSR